MWICLTLLTVALSGTAAADFDRFRDTARYRIEYRVDLTALPEGASRRVWVPSPADTAFQTIHEREIRAPWPHRVSEDALGNRIVYLEDPGDGSQGELVMRFVVERLPATARPARASVPRDDPERYLAAKRRIPLDGLIAQVARQEAEGISGEAALSRAFYDYIYRTMRYSKEGEGWGQGDAVWACTSKYGNCTDFHSLYIGMARSQSLPARFVIGFPIDHDRERADVSGYHCWAEVYQREAGWLPFDASEAWKAKQPDAFYGVLPSDRVEFTVGRDLTLEPPQAGAPLNYLIYPYAEVDGVPAETLPFRFGYERVGIGAAGESTGGQARPGAADPRSDRRQPST